MTERLGRRCGDCAFFEGDRCHRLPPTTFLVALDSQPPVVYQHVSDWPSVDPVEGWCGEYR